MAEDATHPATIVGQGRTSPRPARTAFDSTITPQPHMELDREEVGLWMGHAPPAPRAPVDGGGEAMAAENREQRVRIAELERDKEALEAHNKELRGLLEDAEAALRRSADSAAAPAEAVSPASAHSSETLVGQLVSMAQLLAQTCELNVELQRQLARQNGDQSAAETRAEALHSICEIVDRLKGQENR